jgi:hypothetical protein
MQETILKNGRQYRLHPVYQHKDIISSHFVHCFNFLKNYDNTKSAFLKLEV